MYVQSVRQLRTSVDSPTRRDRAPWRSSRAPEPIASASVVARSKCARRLVSPRRLRSWRQYAACAFTSSTHPEVHMTPLHFCSRAARSKLSWLALLAIVPFVGCNHDEDDDDHGDGTTPTVRATAPADQVTDVAINTQIAVAFSEAMFAPSINPATFTLTDGVTPVTGAVDYADAGTTAIFTPVGALAASTPYTATLTTAIKDASGNKLASYSWTFTTGTTADAVAPTVVSSIPAHLDTGVATNAAVTVAFSEPMDPSTVGATSFVVTGPGVTPVTGAVELDFANNSATFTPSSDLAVSTLFTGTITTDATDLAGNALAADHQITFTTGTTPSAGPAPVLLQTAGNYGILAKSGISTTGVTAITGDLGVSPAASTAITGFALVLDGSGQFATSSLVTGEIFASDYAPPTPSVLTTAVLDMQAAYTDAAGRTSPDVTNLGAGDIGGLTLVPGLYKWGTGVSIPTTVTLSGGANDVWIFQIAGNLTVADAVAVALTGGAQPRNIFWQVAGQATLGTTCDFSGILLCQTLIAADSGAVLTGRALSQTAVTLIGTTLTTP
ncbi:MAG: DUF3494 domain-containing protein [Planctomycetota bacterium]|nr:MAG: DUF3494 domain-containing protein [Planctomycetota bacterium]